MLMIVSVAVRTRRGRCQPLLSRRWPHSPFVTTAPGPTGQPHGVAPGRRGGGGNPPSPEPQGPRDPSGQKCPPLQSPRLSLEENNETSYKMQRILRSRDPKMPTSPYRGSDIQNPGPQVCASFHLASRPRPCQPARYRFQEVPGFPRGFRTAESQGRTGESFTMRVSHPWASDTPMAVSQCGLPQSQAQDRGSLRELGYPRGARSLPRAQDWPSPSRSRRDTGPHVQCLQKHRLKRARPARRAAGGGLWLNVPHTLGQTVPLPSPR